MLKRPKIRPWMLRKEVSILYYALKDKRTNGISKVPVIISLVYLFLPIDFIPDFIPFLGYLDDLVIVPLLLNWSIRLLPENVREDSILKAGRNKRKWQFAGLFVVLIFIGIMVGTFYLFRYLYRTW